MTIYKFEEKEADIKKLIKDIKKDFSGDNEKQMGAVQLLKGILTSDDDLAKKFAKELDKATTEIADKLTKD